MVDGSEYNVVIPAGVGVGHKFLAVFPTAPMRAAAFERMGYGDGGYGAEDADDNDAMAAAIAASLGDMQAAEDAKKAADEEMEAIATAIVESGIEDEPLAE